MSAPDDPTAPGSLALLLLLRAAGTDAEVRRLHIYETVPAGTRPRGRNIYEAMPAGPPPSARIIAAVSPDQVHFGPGQTFTGLVQEVLDIFARQHSDQAQFYTELGTAWRKYRTPHLFTTLAGVTVQATLAQACLSYFFTDMRARTPDGRMTAAGYTEPSPRAWPEDAVERWLHEDDLTALWPYMDGQG